MAILYDSLAWQNSGTAWTPINSTLGWNESIGAGKLTYARSTVRCKVFVSGVWGWEYVTLYSGYGYQDPNGTWHDTDILFAVNTNDCGFDTGPQTGYAPDNSGIYIDATTPTAPVLHWPSGKGFDGSTTTDANGNMASASVPNGSEVDWTDSAGHIALKIVNVSSSEIDYKYPDTTGNYQTIKLL